ncbi:hypothetical protein BSKO_06661 [Bryopsis sp. KO-2023]|nr:hypothetical protein BSKO_06661 [Bryopsis sp. KO-2023]
MWMLVRRLVGYLLAFGKLPEHVAFIMDGNRRYALRENKDKIAGHSDGYRKMVELIHWCLDLGIPTISVYAFSIENFKRSPKEVEALMNMAERKYRELIEEGGLANEVGLVIKALGDLSLAPEGVQRSAARMMTHCDKLQKKKATLNVCFSYTSSQEICQAVSAVQGGLDKKELDSTDVDASLLEQCLYTNSSPPVDLMIRTSGEKRLSDFLLWQCRHAVLVFENVLWPDYSFLDFVSALLAFQRNAVDHNELRGSTEISPKSHDPLSERQNSCSLKDGSTENTGFTVCCRGDFAECRSHSKPEDQCKERNRNGVSELETSANRLCGSVRATDCKRISKFLEGREALFKRWLQIRGSPPP